MASQTIVMPRRNVDGFRPARSKARVLSMRPAPVEEISQLELRDFRIARIVVEDIQRTFEKKCNELTERIRRGAAVEPGPYRFDLKTLKVEEE